MYEDCFWTFWVSKTLDQAVMAALPMPPYNSIRMQRMQCVTPTVHSLRKEYPEIPVCH